MLLLQITKVAIAVSSMLEVTCAAALISPNGVEKVALVRREDEYFKREALIPRTGKLVKGAPVPLEDLAAAGFDIHNLPWMPKDQKTNSSDHSELSSRSTEPECTTNGASPATVYCQAGTDYFNGNQNSCCQQNHYGSYCTQMNQAGDAYFAICGTPGECTTYCTECGGYFQNILDQCQVSYAGGNRASGTQTTYGNANLYVVMY